MSVDLQKKSVKELLSSVIIIEICTLVVDFAHFILFLFVDSDFIINFAGKY